MFKQYTGIEYLAIDVANAYGLDKQTFEDRIQWVKTRQNALESLADAAEDTPLYIKSVMHFRKALKGMPTGHTVALDAVCSGLQLMSVLTGDESGCYLTGLIDPEARTDAYTIITERMNALLSQAVTVPRKEAKQAIMTCLYGSKAKPIEIFGKDSEALEAFYKVLNRDCKGAMALLRILSKAWKADREYNHWTMPDGFNVYIPVMQSVVDRVKVDSLNYTMSVQTWVNKPKDWSASLCPNMIHSVDAYVLRTLVRRCNYNVKQVNHAIEVIHEELLYSRAVDYNYCAEAVMPIHLYLKTGLADIVCIKDIDNIAKHLPTSMLEKLLHTLLQMVKHKPFEVITVHDSFACHANNCNVLRYWYKEILAEIAESTLLDWLLSQIMEDDVTYRKDNPNLAPLIRQSNYGIN